MAGEWEVVSVTPMPASPYEPNAKFRQRMDQTYGAGKWRETSGYRDPAHNTAVGGVRGSTHTRGTPDAPGAHDIVVSGMSEADAAGRLPAGYKGLAEGDHLHVTDADPWQVVSQEPMRPSPPRVTTADIQKRLGPSPSQLALAQARKPSSQGGVVAPSYLEPGIQAERQATLGLSDAATAAEFAAGSQVPRLFGKKPGYGMGEAYEAARRVENEETQKRGGVGSTVGGIVGGLAGLGTGATELKATAAALKGAEGLAPRLLPAVKSGAKLGAVAGAAGAEKPRDIPVSMAAGAVAGGALGVVGEALISGGKMAANAVGTLTENKIGSAVEAAAHRLRLALYKDGLRGPELDKTLEEWRKSGVTATLLDVGGKHTAKLIRQAGSSGSAQRVVDRYARQTEDELTTESIKDAERLVRDNKPLADVRKGLEDKRRLTAQQKYPRQNATQVDYGPIIGAMKDKEVRTVLNEARKTAAIARDEAKVKDIDKIIHQLKLAESEDQQPLAHPSVQAGTLDAIQSAFQRAAKNIAAKNPARARFLNERADEIGKHLDQLPALKDARRTYRLYSEMIKGLDQGAEFLKAYGAEDPIREFSRMNKGAQQMARLGARQELKDQLAKGAPGVLSRISNTSSPQYRIMEAMFGKDEAARFARMAEFRLQKSAAGARAAGGTPREPERGIGPFAHSPTAAARHRAIQAVSDAFHGLSRKEAEAVASLGTAPAGDTLRTIAPRPQTRVAGTGQAMRRGAAIGMANAPRRRRRTDDQ